MATLREMIAQLSPESQKRIEELTRKLIAEEKAIRKAREELFPHHQKRVAARTPPWR